MITIEAGVHIFKPKALSIQLAHLASHLERLKRISDKKLYQFGDLEYLLMLNAALDVYVGNICLAEPEFSYLHHTDTSLLLSASILGADTLDYFRFFGLNQRERKQLGDRAISYVIIPFIKRQPHMQARIVLPLKPPFKEVGFRTPRSFIDHLLTI
jgi:hypothetical protein